MATKADKPFFTRKSMVHSRPLSFFEAMEKEHGTQKHAAVACDVSIMTYYVHRERATRQALGVPNAYQTRGKRNPSKVVENVIIQPREDGSFNLHFEEVITRNKVNVVTAEQAAQVLKKFGKKARYVGYIASE